MYERGVPQDLTRFRHFIEKRSVPEVEEAIEQGWEYLDTQQDSDGPMYILGWARDKPPLWDKVPYLGYLTEDGYVVTKRPARVVR